MAQLPADRAKLAAAQGNQVPSALISSQKNINAITEAYDTIDKLYEFATGLISAGTLSKLGIVNVKDYNASGSAQTTTGSITTGTNALTVASVIDFAVGQGIAVTGAGAAGALLITTINGISGTTITLSANASTTVTSLTVSHDDTAAIQAAINVAKTTKTVVWIPPGTYRVTSTLVVTNGEAFGCMIQGANTEGTKIISYLTGTNPVFSFRGGSGTFSNCGITDLTINPNVNYQGTAIKIDGQNTVLIQNLRIDNMNYGLWLINDSPGAFTETIQVEGTTINYCNNCIRMEQGGGNDSFHGCDFTNVYINVGANQTGFNHVSGYYYNGRFRLFMWGHATTSVYINANGNTEHCVGDITYESFVTTKLTGNGKFYFSGFLRGIGGISDETVGASGKFVIVCTNYFKGTTNTQLSQTISPIIEMGQDLNGVQTGLYKVTGANTEAVLLNAYAFGTNGKTYFGQTPFNGGLDDTAMGAHVVNDGSEFKTYKSSGMNFKTSDNNTALTLNSGRFTGNPGKAGSISVSANAGVPQNITIPSTYSDASVFYLASIHLSGSSVEFRRTYVVNHQGFGGSGSATLLSTHYELNTAGVTINSVTVDTGGNIVVNVTTDRTLTINWKAMGIGLF